MKNIIIILAVTLLPTILFGQQRTIKGRLVNVDDLTPIPGWTVIEPGTTNGTVTNIDGEFTLTLNSPLAIIWFPQCFTQLYAEYEDNVDFKEIAIGIDIKSQIYKDSKKIEQKLARAQPSRNLWGVVIDRKTKAPLDSCEIKLKGTDNIVYSDNIGGFMIKVPNNRTIELEVRKDKSFQLVTYNLDVNFKKIKLNKVRFE